MPPAASADSFLSTSATVGRPFIAINMVMLRSLSEAAKTPPANKTKVTMLYLMENNLLIFTVSHTNSISFTFPSKFPPATIIGTPFQEVRISVCR